MSHRAGVRAAAPIPFTDFQESDLILYVAYFLKGSLGPPSSCPWLAVSRDACATSLNVAAERLESPVQCITEAAQRKRKHMPEAPETQTDPADPLKKTNSPHTDLLRARRPKARDLRTSLKAGRWSGLLSGLLELFYGCWGC